MKNKVAILLGSKTDKPLIEPSLAYYEHFGINVEVHVMSAHRNPKDVGNFASKARDNGYSILIGSYKNFIFINTIKYLVIIINTIVI